MYPMNILSRPCPRLNINEIYLFINIKYFYPKLSRETKEKKKPNFKPSIFKAKLKKEKKNSSKPRQKIKQVPGQT